jgi:hypothetical protein
MHTLLTALAVDRDADRRREAYLYHASDLARDRTSVGRRGRHLLAVALTRLSLASAGAVRALDGCVAEDLTRRLDPL